VCALDEEGDEASAVGQERHDLGADARLGRHHRGAMLVRAVDADSSVSWPGTRNTYRVPATLTT